MTLGGRGVCGFRGRRTWVGLACALAVAVGCASFAASAGAYVYWSNQNGNGGNGTTIGRANLDGTGVDQSFIGGANAPWGVAVDSSHVYWANAGGLGDAIGRANLDGTGVNQDFLTITGAPSGVAVDSNHLYWTNAGASGSIGRANLDGSSADENFITGTTDPLAVTVDASHIYWIDYRSSGSTIGRANLDGTGVDQSFITGLDLPQGLAVNANYIYWANTGDTTIGRANLDGTGVDQSFITGASAPAAVAVDASHVYWANLDTNTIGRANLDGTAVDRSFVTGTDGPFGLAVDALGATSTAASDTQVGFSSAAQNVSLTAAVSSTGGPVNEGTVTFTVKQGPTTIGTATSAPVTNGQASVSYALPAATPAGGYTIDAAYTPGADFTASSDTAHTLTISPASTSTVTSDATARFSTAAQNVGLAAAVSSPGGAINQGTVTFTVTHGATTIGTVTSAPVTNGQASVSYALPAATPAGGYTINAAYTPGADFTASSDTTHSLTVSPAAPVVGAPSVAIASPAGGARYRLGETVTASYACAEGSSGPGIATCAGPVPSGRPVNTSTPGKFTFTVTAASADGQTTSQRVTYTVAPPSNQFTVRRLKLARTGAITFDVKVPGRGRVDVLATAWRDNLALARTAALLQPAPRRFVFARARATAGRAGTLRVRILPNSRGRRLVRHPTYPVTLRLWVSYTPTAGHRRSAGFYGLHIGPRR